MSGHEFSTGLHVRDHKNDKILEDHNGNAVGRAYARTSFGQQRGLRIELPAEANARLWSKAGALLEACEMGLAGTPLGGPELLRYAANTIESRDAEQIRVNMIAALRAKAKAEQAAIDAVKREKT